MRYMAALYKWLFYSFVLWVIAPPSVLATSHEAGSGGATVPGPEGGVTVPGAEGGATVPGPEEGSTVGGTGSGGRGPALQNPLGDDIVSIQDLIKLLLESVVLPIGSIVVVFFIILSGFKFVTAQGKPDQISEAKTMFVWTLVGAAVLLGSWAIALAIEGTMCEITGNSIPGLCQ